ncbi:MFS transporter, partial [Stenotrophomonas maltophilia]
MLLQASGLLLMALLPQPAFALAALLFALMGAGAACAAAPRRRWLPGMLLQASGLLLMALLPQPAFALAALLFALMGAG